MKSPLEQEMRRLLGDGRNADIASAYCGLNGRGGTLRRVATDSGLSHETVRTIVRAVSRKLSTTRPATPILDRAIASVASLVPATAGEIEAALRSQGLASDLVSVQCVMLLGRLFGKDLPFSTARVRGELLVQPRNHSSASYVVRAATLLAARRGLISVSAVTQSLNDRGEATTEDAVRCALLSSIRFCSLDENKTWFRLSSGHRQNPLVSRTRKILSVVSCVPLHEVRRAILRGYRLKELSVPLDVLRDFFRTLPGLSLSDNIVAAVPELDPTCVLSPIEQQFVRVLKSYDRPMPRELFLSQCHALGIKPRTMMQHMTYSPLIMRHGAGVYALVGAGPVASGNKKGARQAPSGA